MSQILSGHRILAHSAAAADVPLGLVAQAVLERRDEALVLAWLLCARAKRRRLRSTAAFFRAGVFGRRSESRKPKAESPLSEPRLCDHVQAKRLLAGAGVEDLGFARCLPDLAGKRPADYWREAARARAQAKRAEQLQKVKRLLPCLTGADRRRAERLLASA